MVGSNAGNERRFEAVVTITMSGFILFFGLFMFLNSTPPCYSPWGDWVCGPVTAGAGILLLVVGAALLIVGLVWATVVPRNRGPDAKIR